MRDGISLTAQKKQRRLLMPTEIAQLPDLVCYVQYPENTPIAKLKMTFKKRKNRQESFGEKDRGSVRNKKTLFLKKVDINNDARYYKNMILHLNAKKQKGYGFWKK
jgi:type IV secretory pathway TraG/TraD family ATPase VirD4